MYCLVCTNPQQGTRQHISLGPQKTAHRETQGIESENNPLNRPSQAGSTRTSILDAACIHMQVAEQITHILRGVETPRSTRQCVGEARSAPAAAARVLAVLVGAARAGVVLFATQAARAQRQRALVQVHQPGSALCKALRQRLQNT